MQAPDPKKTADHWDHMAESYDAAKHRNDVYYGTLKACFEKAVPLRMRRRMLEIGCGTGQVLASLKPEQGVGIDSSRRMIAVAQQQFADCRALEFHVMDAAAASQLGEFDAVISADVMEHVPSWRAVVQAMVQACAQPGVIAITTPNPRWAAPLWLLEKLKLKMPEGPHQFVDAREIAAELRRQGCVVQKVSTHLLIPARLGGIGPALSRWSQTKPLLRNLGVIQLIVATR